MTTKSWIVLGATSAAVIAVVLVAAIVIGISVGAASLREGAEKQLAQKKLLAQAKLGACKQDVSMIASSLALFEQDVGRYPNSQEGLQALLSQPSGVTHWQGPYVEHIPIDPWGNPYHYACPGLHGKSGFDMYSFGPDGQDGGGDDIGNRE